MSSLAPLLGDIQQAKKKQKSTNESITSALEAVETQIADLLTQARQAAAASTSAEDGAASPSFDAVKAAEKASKCIKMGQDMCLKSQKELHAVVSKLGKAVDKVVPEIAEGAMDCRALPREPIIGAVAHHLYREATAEIGEGFCEASGATVDDGVITSLRELSRLAGAIDRGDLRAPLQWATCERQALRKHGCTHIELSLHRLKYIQLLGEGKVTDALEYGREYFSEVLSNASETSTSPTDPTDTSAVNEIRRLYGAIVFAGSRDKLLASPYGYLLQPQAWRDVKVEFIQACSQVFGFPKNSALFTALSTGCHTVPTLLKFAQIARARGANSQAGLATVFEVDLPPKFLFHSTFNCPVTREPASDANPPMLLSCGHVIANQSMLRLARGQSRVKCPYCPEEASVHTAMRLNF